jgi:polyhydroxyalkanoate synthesis regulator phasin
MHDDIKVGLELQATHHVRILESEIQRLRRQVDDLMCGHAVLSAKGDTLRARLAELEAKEAGQ